MLHASCTLVYLRRGAVGMLRCILSSRVVVDHVPCLPYTPRLTWRSWVDVPLNNIAVVDHASRLLYIHVSFHWEKLGECPNEQQTCSEACLVNVTLNNKVIAGHASCLVYTCHLTWRARVNVTLNNTVVVDHASPCCTLVYSR